MRAARDERGELGAIAARLRRVAVVERDVRGIGGELRGGDAAAERVARAVEIAERREQRGMLAQVRARIGVVAVNDCSAAARCAAVRARTTTSTVSVAGTRAASLPRSRTAGASRGSRYAKSAYTGRRNATSAIAATRMATCATMIARPRRRSHATYRSASRKREG
jgi:hypothetical protein